MAEVGQRLVSGTYRLSAVRTSRSRPVCTEGSPRCLIINCAFGSGRVKEESVRDQPAVQPVSESKEARLKSEKLSTVRKSENHQENVAVICATSHSCLTRFLENQETLGYHKTSLYHHTRLLQEKLQPYRMAPWIRGAPSIHSDTFRSPQQVRAFCTFVFIFAEQELDRLGSRQRLRNQNLHPGIMKANFTTTRSYSWSTEAAPLLHRSRTAYYDILKVSPSATQSQIKTAYYKQSFIYHPDKNPGSKEATQHFSAISEAYTVLGNISLRRKYDRGILSQSDIQNAGRPSSKEASSRSAGSPQQQQQQRARRFSQAGGRPIFDFDAFYRAHYGEQLQRERDLRARKQRMQEEMKEHRSRWRQKKMLEVAATMLVATAGLIIISFKGL